MTGSFYLALRYLRFHAARSAILVVTVALILTVPAAIHLLLGASERQLVARATSTPLLVGARGSTLDLVMNSLYFSDDRPPVTSSAASEEIWDSGLATAIPLYVRFASEGVPIVGTTLDYFAFRDLEIAEGRGLALLGEAVLGAEAARLMARGPGDHLVSSPENLFDLAGAYPLRMSVVGVLAPTGGPDDRAIFVDLKTAWVIGGIGHGHDAASATGDVIAQSDDNLTAGAALPTFNQITPQNIDSFHFHGDPESYPLSAVIAVPNDLRSGIILRGRYLERDQPLQIVIPRDAVAGLLATIFRITQVLNAVVATIAVAALLAVALAFYLSLELRRDEIATVFKLGGKRLTILRLILSEIAIIFGASIVLATLLIIAIGYGQEGIIVWLLNS